MVKKIEIVCRPGATQARTLEQIGRQVEPLEADQLPELRGG